MRQSRAAPRPRASSKSRAPAPSARRPSPAETGLLELAQALGRIAQGYPENRSAFVAVRSLLVSAFGPGAALPRQLAQAWLRTRRDKTAALALGWAREQVRRALVEVWQREPGRGGSSADVPADVAAWLLLAVAEAEAHEPGGTVGDRLGVVCDLLGLLEHG